MFGFVLSVGAFCLTHRDDVAVVVVLVVVLVVEKATLDDDEKKPRLLLRAGDLFSAAGIHRRREHRAQAELFLEAR